MIREASAADLPSLRELLRGSNDAPYDIGVVAQEKVFGAGYSGPPAVRVYGDFAGVSVTCGKYLRLLTVDRAHRRRGIGTALLRDAESRGANVVAAEPGNYFTPGVLDSDRSTLRFFRHRGYQETATTQNLEAPATGYRLPETVRDDCRTDVLAFIEHHFGAIWRFEASRGPTIFHVRVNGEIAGFSTHDANNRGLGFFGPTGVAESMRGRGLGRQLLVASLGDLAQRGYQRVVIPWTDAIEFYRKSCGAKIAHRFVILRRIAP
jgi:GNAT superfamily N-acetyltransferase